MKNISVIGSTGSIGRQALEVIGRYPDRFRAVALCANESAELLAAQAGAFRPELAVLRSADKNISFRCRPNGIPPFENGNPVLCALLVRNLVDNAVKYSPRGAHVEITVRNGELRVINSGTSITPDNLSRLGQRFFRPAGQKETGSGLGLSIVSRIASFYGCRIKFNNDKKGFCVSIAPLED